MRGGLWLLLLGACLVAERACAFVPSMGRLPIRQSFSLCKTAPASTTPGLSLRARSVHSLKMSTDLSVSADAAWTRAETGDLSMLQSIVLGQDITLLRPDPSGEAVQLAEILKGKSKALVCFMRHVGTSPALLSSRRVAFSC
jgi:hypothetical protein